MAAESKDLAEMRQEYGLLKIAYEHALHIFKQADQCATEREAQILSLLSQRDELVEALEAALMPVEMYHAYGWADRGRVIPKIKAVLAKARGDK